MPQVLKDDVRARIEAAALEVFADQGFAGATMAAIAERAGVATANVYRYHRGKDELFAAVITPGFVERFEALVDRRVRALGPLGRGRAAGGPAEDLLRFWLDHRAAVVVLLDGAAGTPQAGFADRFVERLVDLTVAEVRAARPGVRITAPNRFVLTAIFTSTLRMLADVLRSQPTERAARQAIEAFWSYQVPGLRGFVSHLVDT